MQVGPLTVQKKPLPMRCGVVAVVVAAAAALEPKTKEDLQIEAHTSMVQLLPVPGQPADEVVAHPERISAK